MGCGQSGLGWPSAEGYDGGGSGHGPEGKLRSLEKTERALGMWREQEGLKCEVKKVAVPC